MEVVQVNLEEKSYPIYVTTNSWLDFQKVLPKTSNLTSALIISDENVHPLYTKQISDEFTKIGIKVFTSVIPAGENSKSLQHYETLITDCLEHGLNRHSLIVALGGGVTGDLAGFVAATYMRGIRFMQIPTTLLSQVDSSVGGKVAVNHSLAKNVIGCFYQPSLVYINTQTLATLPKREFYSGLAEVIKHGLICDKEYLSLIDNKMEQILSLDLEVLAKVVSTSCKIKSNIVEQDEKETGIRAILNFGHTIGHAIEASAGYATFTHGEAVSIGMHSESLIAKEIGLVDSSYLNYIESILQRAHLPTRMPSIDVDLLLRKMFLDKKNEGDKITMILPTGIGKVDIFKDIKIDTIKSVITKGA